MHFFVIFLKKVRFSVKNTWFYHTFGATTPLLTAEKFASLHPTISKDFCRYDKIAYLYATNNINRYEKT